MNRDGYRSGLAVAHHEAAHGVVAVLVGHVLGRVDIAPSRAERARGVEGHVDHELPWVPWPIPLRRNSLAVICAAGFVWEATVLRHGVRASWDAAGGDRQITGLPRFLLGAVTAWRLLRDQRVRAAVRQTVYAVRASRGGFVYGTTVAGICEHLGLIDQAYPDPDPDVALAA